MANSRIVTTNFLSTATLTNNTGGGSPALDEASGYPTTRAQNADRESVWKTSATPSSPINVDFDLGSARTVNVAAALGFRAASGVGAATTVVVYSSSTATYPRTWDARGSFSLTNAPRDAGDSFADVSARYWRFEIACTAQFQIGRLFVGNATDLGGIHARGGLSSPYRNRNEQPLLSGVVLIEDLGDMGREFTLTFPAKGDSVRSYFESMSNVSGTLLYLDPDDNIYEVYVPGGRTEHARIFHANGAGLYDLSVRLVRCP